MSIMAKRIMQRLFSIPGLRWRGRIKQFDRDVYDDWGDAIDRSVWASWYDHWVESFAKEIPEVSAILDIGCGTGRALLILTKRRPTLLAGIDISPKASGRAPGWQRQDRRPWRWLLRRVARPSPSCA